MEKAGFSKVCLIGCEGIVAGNEEKVNQLSGKEWEVWADLNYRLGKDVALHGAADHLLYIGRNESA
jgi:S-adenosylmethionine-dependent methyltransferase